jgi:uncharacterized protein YcfJ
MKKVLSISLCALISSAAFAGMLSNGSGYVLSNGSDYVSDNFTNYEIARVVRIQPIGTSRAYTVPRQSCTMVEEGVSVATLPASPGSIVGDPAQQKRMVQRCVQYNDREYQQIVTSYDVTFEFRGQIRTVKMSQDPGNTVRIKTVTTVYVLE